MTARTFRMGTRGSPLALAQTEIVLAALRKHHPDVGFALVPIRTHGDDAAPRDLGMGLDSKRAFTKRIEDALLHGRVDAAVHSMKDLPSEIPRGLVIAAVPARETPLDALVSRARAPLEGLAADARIGTSSLRRRSQLLAYRPSLRVLELRGNLGTRLGRLDDGGFDAVVVAAAGLLRLGLGDRIVQLLPAEVMVPAIGQGALAVEVREDDDAARSLVSAIDDPRSRAETDAERGVARRLGGGCNIPLGAIATSDGGRMRLQATLGSPDGGRVARAFAEGSLEGGGSLAEEVSERLRSMAGDLLEELREVDAG